MNIRILILAIKSIVKNIRWIVNYDPVGRQKMQRQIRSESEKISDILRSIRNCNGTKTTQIMYETCIPHNQLKEYLALMIQNGLIVYVKEEKTFRITDYGMNVFKLCDKMDKLLVYNPTRLNDY